MTLTRPKASSRYGRTWIAIVFGGILGIGALVGATASWHVGTAVEAQLRAHLKARAETHVSNVERFLSVLNQVKADIAEHPVLVNAVMQADDSTLLAQARDHLRLVRVLGEVPQFMLVDFEGEEVSNPDQLTCRFDESSLTSLLEGDVHELNVFAVEDRELVFQQVHPLFYGEGGIEGAILTQTRPDLDQIVPRFKSRDDVQARIRVSGQVLRDVDDVEIGDALFLPAVDVSGLEVTLVGDRCAIREARTTLATQIALILLTLCAIMAVPAWWIGRRALVEPHERTLRLVRELDEALECAEAATRAKTQFLANTSHELRTPFNGILGMLELLDGSNLDEEQRELQSRATASATTLLGILDDILDFSRIEEGRLPIAETEFDLRELLDELIHLLAPSAEKKGLRLVVRGDSGFPRWLHTDPLRLRQILSNLISNAIKFTEEGSVTLTLTHREGTLGFSIQDTGIGIDPDRLEAIFDPFEQAENSTARKFGGTGLGLTISKSLADMLGASLEARSAPGQGATFSLSFHESLLRRSEETLVGPCAGDKGRDVTIALEPMEADALFEMIGPNPNIRRCDQPGGLDSLGKDSASGLLIIDPSIYDTDSIGQGFEVYRLRKGDERKDSDSAQREIASPLLPWRLVELTYPPVRHGASAGAHANANLGLRVLVAEDNLTNQFLVCKQLKILGCDAEVVPDGQGAIDAVQATEFDVILMDMQMPGVDGPQACRAIRERGMTLPILALTANVMDSDRAICREAGMDGFLAKPLKLSELAEKLGSLRKPHPSAGS